MTFFTSQRWPTVSGLTGWKEAILSGKQSKEAERALNFAHNCAHSLGSETPVKSLGNFFGKISKNNPAPPFWMRWLYFCPRFLNFFALSPTRSLIQQPGTYYDREEKWSWWIIWGFICLRITLGLAPDFKWSRVTLLNCNGDYQISESGRGTLGWPAGTRVLMPAGQSVMVSVHQLFYLLLVFYLLCCAS